MNSSNLLSLLQTLLAGGAIIAAVALSNREFRQREAVRKKEKEEFAHAGMKLIENQRAIMPRVVQVIENSRDEGVASEFVSRGHLETSGAVLQRNMWIREAIGLHQSLVALREKCPPYPQLLEAFSEGIHAVANAEALLARPLTLEVAYEMWRQWSGLASCSYGLMRFANLHFYEERKLYWGEVRK